MFSNTNKYVVLTLALLFFHCIAMLSAARVVVSDPQEGVYLNTRDGVHRLHETEAEFLQSNMSLSVFQRMVQHFETQRTTSYCGVASSCIVCNMLAIPRPTFYRTDSGYQYFTQNNIFNFQHNSDPKFHLDANQVLSHGMTLQELGLFLHNQDPDSLSIDVYHAGNSSVQELRSIVNRVLRPNNRTEVKDQDYRLGKNQYILVNYDRQHVGQSNGMAGHISPLAAYHPEQDEVLVMDVARYKFPPVWVPLTQLFNAMNSTDPLAKKSRGYVVVGPAEGARPADLFSHPPSSWLASPIVKLGMLISATSFMSGIIIVLMIQTILWLCYKEVWRSGRRNSVYLRTDESSF